LGFQFPKELLHRIFVGHITNTKKSGYRNKHQVLIGQLGIQKMDIANLVGGFNPSEKYESVGICWDYHSKYMEKF